MRTLAIWLLLAGTLAAQKVEVPKHLAETVHESELADAKHHNELAVAESAKRCKEALERASKAAAMKGELDKAVAYRDRAAAIKTATTDSPLVGKFEMKYASGDTHLYMFSNDGKLRMLANDSGTFDPPREAFVLWGLRDKEMAGFAFWPAEGSGAVEAFTVADGKPVSKFYPRPTAINGVAERVK